MLSRALSLSLPRARVGRLELTHGVVETPVFVELVLLRWIPANVTYIGFFSNFLLMASFLGIGLGILLGRRWASLRWSPFPLLLLLVYNVATTGHVFNPGYEYQYQLEANGYPTLGYHPDWSMEDPRYIPQNVGIALFGLYGLARCLG